MVISSLSKWFPLKASLVRSWWEKQSERSTHSRPLLLISSVGVLPVAGAENKDDSDFFSKNEVLYFLSDMYCL